MEQSRSERESGSVGQQSLNEKKRTIPHMCNLNEDKMLNKVIHHYFEKGRQIKHLLVTLTFTNEHF